MGSEKCGFVIFIKVVGMADAFELLLQIILANIIIAQLAWGGEKFASDIEPSRVWLVGANWLKRGLRSPSGEKLSPPKHAGGD